MKTIRKLLFSIFWVINWPILRFNKVQFHHLEIHGILLIHNKGLVRLGRGGRINSSKYKNIIGGDTRSSLVVKKNAILEIGKNFKMSNSAIYCANQIIIGDNVMIGGSCKLWDSDFHPLNPEERVMNANENFNTKPITIGDNVFIGGCSIILKGVTIGDSAIIGAGSVVSRNIPSGEVWAGNPAQFVKKIRTNEVAYTV